MKKIFLSIVGGAIVLVAGFYFLNNYIYEEKQAVTAADYKNAEYIIDGRRIALIDGVSEIETATSSASKIVTRYFGNEVKKDLNDDGREDIVFLLTQETGGSGTFFYVVAALNTEEGYRGSEGLLLGDRIAPQTTEVSRNPNHKNVIVVNYADRALGQPMTEKPSMGKSIWLKLDPSTLQFGEVVQNFEGEADPSRMTLGMKPWVWVKALYNDGREIVPKTSGKFSVTFGTEGRFSATTDCNTIAGNYVADKDTVTFDSISSTKKYCQGSQESDFSTLLKNTETYHFTSKGELIFGLKFDSGSVIFK